MCKLYFVLLANELAANDGANDNVDELLGAERLEFVLDVAGEHGVDVVAERRRRSAQRVTLGNAAQARAIVAGQCHARVRWHAVGAGQRNEAQLQANEFVAGAAQRE
jgi:hypothetical protein